MHTANSSSEHVFVKKEIEQSIADRFAQQVRSHGARLAVGAGRNSLTYRELDEYSNQIARAVGAIDRAAGTPVAVYLEQGSAQIAAILGVLKVGRIYVPLDPGHSMDHLKSMLVDSDAALILTDSANRARADDLAGSQLRVLDVTSELGSCSSDPFPTAIGPDAPAYIYYTSGSTGQPKGVVDNHRNVLHNVMRYSNNLRITPNDRLTLVQSCGFSGAVSNIFCALMNGAAVFPIDLRRIGIEGLADRIETEGLTIYHSVPTIFQRLLRTHRAFESLRVVRLEGDRATLDDLALFRRHFRHDCVLVNGLGATETGITRQYFATTRTLPTGTHLPIGSATEDMHMLLLDDQGIEVAPGEVGEIAVRSRYLACGYWKQPELTSARFLQCPENPAERIYLSGDLGYLNPAGELVHLGRKDLRRKFNGEWLDTDAIELELNADATVEQALVEVRDDDGKSRVVAYVLGVRGALPSASRLRKRLLEAGFDESRIPTAFVRLEALPLDANGKVSRRNLPAPPTPSPASFEPARTASERRVAAAFAAVLGYSRVGRHDDLYALGGDSLDAVNVALELENTGGPALSLGLFAEATTVARLAAAIDGHAAAGSLVTLQPQGSRVPFFCVHAHMGHVVNLRQLAQCLGSERPFFALQLGDLGRRDQPPTSMAEIARNYVAEIRQVRPNGPYLLGGYCYGGIVAMEMARVLEQAGESVSLLTLIDTRCPDNSTAAAESRLVRLWRRVRAGEQIRWGRALKNYGINALENLRTAAHHAMWRYCLDHARHLPRSLREPEMLLRMIELDHVPRPLRCRTLIIEPVENGVLPQPEDAWRPLFEGDLTIEPISSSAADLLREPQVRRLAGSLEAYLAKH